MTLKPNCIQREKLSRRVQSEYRLAKDRADFPADTPRGRSFVHAPRPTKITRFSSLEEFSRVKFWDKLVVELSS